MSIATYKKGEIIFFGCGLKHPWSQRQDDGTYVVTCPNKSKPGVEAAALVKIADIRAKRKARQLGWKDKKKLKTRQMPPLRH